jgi:hypothetical protein
MKICPNCDHANQDSAKFCAECGTALTAIERTVAPTEVVPEGGEQRPARQMEEITEIGKKRPIGIIVGILLAALAGICLISVICTGIFAINRNRTSMNASATFLQKTVIAQDQATSTDEPTATVESQVEPTLTPDLTATAGAQATDQALVNTADAQETLQADENATATSQALVDPTEEAREEFIADITSSKSVLYGPRSGNLVHDGDDFLEASPSTPGVRNFIAEVTFQNPYAASEGQWDIGIIFRSEGNNQQFRLILVSDESWGLTLNTGSASGVLVTSGDLPNLNIGDAGTNTIRIIGYEDQGWFYLNDVFISEFDLTERFIGSVYVVTGLLQDSETPGEITAYEDFTVWSIK